jgi:2-isopropylmalate synthase
MLAGPNGEIEHMAAEGNGPVNALDTALRRALSRFYPEVGEVRLYDYKVRVLGGAGGSAATVRVLIESGDGHERWGTVGVSHNVIEASWQALVDSFEYKIYKTEKQAQPRGASAEQGARPAGKPKVRKTAEARARTAG